MARRITFLTNSLSTSKNAFTSVTGSVTTLVKRDYFGELLNNRPLKTKIAMIVTPLILIGLYGMGFQLWDGYEQYQRSIELERANKASDYFLKAAGEQAKESGFTSTVLSSPSEQTLFAEIAAARLQGDHYADSALALVQQLAQKYSHINHSLQLYTAARRSRDELRTANEAVLGKTKADAAAIQRWIDGQSALILAQESLGHSLFSAVNALEVILELNSNIKEHIFYASEYAGRERANIAAAIGSGKLIDPERYAVLMQARGITQEHIQKILAFRANPNATPEITTAINGMEQAFVRTFEQTRQAVYAASAGNTAYPLTAAEWMGQSTTAINSILRVSDAVTKEVASLTASSHTKSFRDVAVSGTLAVLLVLVILLSNKIGSLVVERVVKLRDVARKVQQGDLTQRINDVLNDEIGELTTSFNGMVTGIAQGVEDLEVEKRSVERKVEEAVRTTEEQRKYLARSVETMLQSVNSFAEGDLTERLTTEREDDITLLFRGYNNALENVRQMMTAIMEKSEITASASTQITVSIEHMAQNINSQSQQAMGISTAMEEMTKTIEETTYQTSIAAEKAAQASQEAVSGGASIRRMIEGVNAVSSIVARSAESVKTLDDSSEQISLVVKEIEEIADQTNLLALNAAIEAARAGDQGRGFAVVADEVRKLAERTQQATKEISSTIRRVQSDTQNVVGSMNAGTKELENTRILVTNASASLESIIAQVQEIADFISQLAATSQEQAAVSNDISQNMDAMSMVISESVAVSEEIVRTSESLNQMTLAVQQLILQFKVAAPTGLPDDGTQHELREQRDEHKQLGS